MNNLVAVGENMHRDSEVESKLHAHTKKLLLHSLTGINSKL